MKEYEGRMIPEDEVLTNIERQVIPELDIPEVEPDR